jgi:hypothetical protein
LNTLFRGQVDGPLKCLLDRRPIPRE